MGEVEVSVDVGTKSAWETSLVTQLDGTPFDDIGRGKQCMLKTELSVALDTDDSMLNALLIEEPENHLSYSNMNQLLNTLSDKSSKHQLFVTTHSSFVTNRLGLDNILLLSDSGNIATLNEVDPEGFFKKRTGYDTLRLILSKKAILVEGDSDDLIVQKAYLDAYGKLPIMDGIDVIVVGTAFKRFLTIAEKLKQRKQLLAEQKGGEKVSVLKILFIKAL